MFTGLVQGIGIIQPLGGDRFTLSVAKNAAPAILPDLAMGDSVAVDGVCLTVEEILLDGFVATASPETLERTTLGQRSETADYVNLETSMRLGSKLGGHFVTGHVDGIGCLVESVSTEKAWEMTFAAARSAERISPLASALSEQWQRYIARYIVPKGSIAVNGISLTVAACDTEGTWFKAAVIPHTYAETNLCYLQIGAQVNIEGDILGKYVDKLLNHRLATTHNLEEISPTFLAEHGYL